MEQKTFTCRMEFKGSDTGEFVAEFATLNVVDHDGDVTLPGAFSQQEVVIEPWNHNWNAPPVGRGMIREDNGKAIVEGRFFTDTASGLEHYRTVKNLADMQEWSYSFDIIDYEYGNFAGKNVRFLKELDVIGVGPVTRGAGIDTRLVAIKRAKAAISSHSTETVDSAWDGPANEARVRSGEDEAYYRRIYAWRDPDGDPAVKSTYRFIHHMVSGNGEPGAANVRACITGIAVLNGARGGTTIPDADRRGVWNHLARHLRDADVEPPELKSLDEIEAKAGARHTSKGFEMIQQIHDLAVELGAKCEKRNGEDDGQDEAGDSKSRSYRARALADRIAIELLEIS